MHFWSHKNAWSLTVLETYEITSGHAHSELKPLKVVQKSEKGERRRRRAG